MFTILLVVAKAFLPHERRKIIIKRVVVLRAESARECSASVVRVQGIVSPGRQIRHIQVIHYGRQGAERRMLAKRLSCVAVTDRTILVPSRHPRHGDIGWRTAVAPVLGTNATKRHEPAQHSR